MTARDARGRPHGPAVATSPVSTARSALPTALITIAWLGLWMFWPHPRAARQTGILPEPRVSFVKFSGAESWMYTDPTRFGRSSRLGFRIVEGADSRPDDLPYRPPPAAVMLDAPPVGPGGLMYPPSMSAGAIAKDSFSPEWPSAPAFGPPAAGRTGLRVTVRGDLGGFGLRMPEFPATIAARTNEAWSVSAYVEMDASGKAANVFLESGTQDAALNANLVRVLLRSELEKPGRHCSGRVVIGFGM